LRRGLLESNVRDYQGKKNIVNRDIHSTLEASDGREFWWLNNGVTILATSYNTSGNKLVIETPEIVNGLQTSYEIYSYFKDHQDKTDTRNILVRVILPKEELTRNRITKATNFQTVVQALSLHATDQIHFDIEDKLKLYNLFYDRKSGKYKNLRKQIDDIISMRSLAQAVMATLLRKPDDARARPGTVINNEKEYPAIFNDKYNRDLYVACILLDRQVQKYLNGREDLSLDVKRNIRYYVEMWVMCDLAKKAEPSHEDVAKLIPLLNPLPDEQVAKVVETVLSVFVSLGASDKVSKGVEFKSKLFTMISEHLSAKA
jgi:hypothetical protein